MHVRYAMCWTKIEVTLVCDEAENQHRRMEQNQQQNEYGKENSSR